MTEAVWNALTDPGPMLAFVTHPPDSFAPLSARKLRLFLVGCCRRQLHLLANKGCREAVDRAELYCDGHISEGRLRHAMAMARTAAASLARRQHRAPRKSQRLAAAEWLALAVAISCESTDRLFSWIDDSVHCDEVCYHVGSAVAEKPFMPPDDEQTYGDLIGAECAHHAALLRCIAGNPFRPAPVAPAWRTSTAISLAAAIYDARAFDRLPVLADALEEAGCQDPAVLAHCRDHPEHARGCWVVDALLGKQ